MTTNRFAASALKLFLIGTLAIFTSGISLSSSKSDELATDKSIKNIKPWANIDGFRSVKFGMQMDEVKDAIGRDFNIFDSNINVITHPT